MMYLGQMLFKLTQDPWRVTHGSFMQELAPQCKPIKHVIDIIDQPNLSHTLLTLISRCWI